MKTSLEPLKPQKLEVPAVHPAVHNTAPTSNGRSAWLVDDKRHKHYYVGVRFNGIETTLPLGIAKSPIPGDKKRARKAKILANEAVNKVQQFMLSLDTDERIGHALSSVINRISALGNEVNLVFHVVTWLKDRYISQPVTLPTLQMHIGVMDTLLKAAKEAKLDFLADVSPRLLTNVMAQYSEPQSHNKRLHVLRSLFRDAVRRGLLIIDPSTHLDEVPFVLIKKAAFEIDEIERILAVCRAGGEQLQEWYMGLLLFICTGIRPGDIFTLKWKNFSEGLRRLEYIPGKTKQSKGNQPVVVIIPEAFSLILRDAKVDPKRVSRTTGGRKFATKCLYSFRKTINCWIAGAGGSDEEQRVLLNNNKSIRDVHYLDPERALARRLANLPELKLILEARKAMQNEAQGSKNGENQKNASGAGGLQQPANSCGNPQNDGEANRPSADKINAMAKEIVSLRKEIERVTRQRDALKELIA